MYTVLDFETTGLHAATDQVIEIGAKKFNYDGEYISTFHTYVQLRQGMKLSDYIKDLTGIDEKKLLAYGVAEKDALLALTHFIGTDAVVAHNASFDLSFLPFANSYRFLCTRTMFKIMHPDKKAGLADLVKYYGVDYKGHHTAICDVEMTAQVLFNHLIPEWEKCQYNYPFNCMVKDVARDLLFIPTDTIVKTPQEFNDELWAVSDKGEGK